MFKQDVKGRDQAGFMIVCVGGPNNNVMCLWQEQTSWKAGFPVLQDIVHRVSMPTRGRAAGGVSQGLAAEV